MPPPFPISDHCDGTRFHNPAGQLQARSFRDLPRWWRDRLILRKFTAWPKSVPPPRQPRLPQGIPARHLAVTFIGHSTFLLQLPGLNILTDPVFATHAGPFGLLGPKRVRPAALRLGELPRIDVVLLSHNHYDHLDLAALRWLARHHRPAIVTTLGNRAWLEQRNVGRLTELDWWQSHHPAADLEVLCTPAQHFAARTPWDRCRTLWGGFMLRSAAGLVFFAGDSGWGPHFAEIQQRLGSPRLALLPIGAYEPRWFMEAVHVTPHQAVQAHRALGAHQSIGMHFGTFNLTDEGIDDPLRALADARAAHGVVAADFDTLEFGETRLIMS